MTLFVKNKKSFFISIFFLTISQIVFAQNKEMDLSRKNCDILDGTTANLAQSYSEQIGIPKKTLQLQGGVWSDYRGCRLLYSTPKGTFTCLFSMLLSSDNGKTTYAAGYGRCEKD